MSIFPANQPVSNSDTIKGLPLAKEVQWDYEANIPVFRGGAPRIITGLEAVKVWVWKTLHTNRFLHAIYSSSYGCDAYLLIGKPYTEQLKNAEAVRYIKECLQINPYISDVSDVDVSFDGDLLKISCTVITIYGEAKIHV